VSRSEATTSVPKLQLTDRGFVVPSEPDVLAGVQADINAALGGAANMALDTPQGQIAMTMSAIIADCHDQLVALLNGIDPALAAGRMQDAIGALYFMSRLPAMPSRVEAILSGTPGQSFRSGARMATDGRHAWLTENDLTLPANGTATVWLQCDQAGAITCPPGALRAYNGVAGLQNVMNPHAGTLGRETESRQAFERRRQQILSGNATGTNAALLGALRDLNGVVDAWVTDNPTDEPMRFGALTLPPHNLFICVAGGETAAIGQVILKKKPPCCATFGQETVTVMDGNAAYKTRQPQYEFHFSRPDDVAIYIDVTLLQNDRIPADALDQIRRAVLQAAQSADGRARLRMGSEILASQFNASLAALGDWVQILGVRLGFRDGETVIPTEKTFLTMEVYQLPYIQEDFITLTLKDSHDA